MPISAVLRRLRNGYRISKAWLRGMLRDVYDEPTTLLRHDYGMYTTLLRGVYTLATEYLRHGYVISTR